MFFQREELHERLLEAHETEKPPGTVTPLDLCAPRSSPTQQSEHLRAKTADTLSLPSLVVNCVGPCARMPSPSSLRSPNSSKTKTVSINMEGAKQLMPEARL